MRKKYIFILLILIFTSSITFGATINLLLQGGKMVKEDESFKQIYGRNITIFGGKIKIHPSTHMFIYSEYDYFSIEGRTLIFQENTKSTQNYFFGGIGYSQRITNLISLESYIGGVFISYKEEALGKTINNNCLGTELGIGIEFKINILLINTNLGYIIANDEINNNEVKLSGIKSTIGFGLEL